ncbi:hypothetical protein TpMuguga_02g00818 [Theileria parva strain Muguga]|uniref:SfiI-subtelomeric related protein family member n=1 Tax=Theileria parva TaxID=5875 RepID=Q4N420_THEPA|nr:uncharacterized protein TpMuguga_02g00818 [Theileria parva strain Muguga]EAN33103.1 hypothetical protein TpMuguga_02g00818 [Theileria parva strain Muguga]|eukprot:XP_765386.1 hypothetical protein [Theileria parva strain Muguga]
MRTLSVSKWILLSLLISRLCGAITKGDSEGPATGECKQPEKPDLGLDSTSGNPVEGVVQTSDDTTIDNSQDTRKSEHSKDQHSSGDHPEDNEKEYEQLSQSVEPTELTDLFSERIFFKAVKLDLDIERDTADFYYKKAKGQSSYTPKLGRVFDKVVVSVPYVSPVVIWESKTLAECASQVSVFSLKNLLLVSVNIFMLDGSKKVFRRYLTESKWKDVTFPENVQLLTTDKDGKEVELDPSNYILNPHCLYEYSYTFNLSPYSKCTEIRHKNNTVWKYGEKYISSDGNYVTTSFYPTSISYILRFTFDEYYRVEKELHDFRISFSDGSYLDSSLENKEWKQIYYIWTPMTLPFPLNAGTAIPLDVTFGESTDQFDYEYYFCSNTGYSDFTIFTAKFDYKFSSVREQTRLIWDNSNDPSEFSTKVVAQTSIKFPDQAKQVTIHTNKGNRIFYRQRGKEKWINAKDNLATYYPGFTVMTLNDDKSTSVNDTSKYNVEYDISLVIYRFKRGVKCVEVRFDNRLVWKHDVGLYGDKYPKYVSFNNVSNNIRLLINDTLYFYSLQDLEWKMIFQIPNNLVRKTFKTKPGFFKLYLMDFIQKNFPQG